MSQSNEPKHWLTPSSESEVVNDLRSRLSTSQQELCKGCSEVGLHLALAATPPELTQENLCFDLSATQSEACWPGRPSFALIRTTDEFNASRDACALCTGLLGLFEEVLGRSEETYLDYHTFRGRSVILGRGLELQKGLFLFANSQALSGYTPRPCPNMSIFRPEFFVEQVGQCLDRSCQRRPVSPEVPHTLRLIDCQSMRVVEATFQVPYVALSYVWGPQVSEPQLQIGRLVDLPRTIADAVTVTKGMGQRYLWVDRYCIDQCNHELKGAQIRSMAAIYERAWVTIISLGPNDQTGLPGVSIPRVEPAVVQTGDMSITIIPRRLRESMDSSVYNTRAWTLQEAYLSPRRLVFAPEQAYFVCQSSSVPECAVGYRQPHEPHIPHNISLFSLGFDKEIPLASRPGVYNAWPRYNFMAMVESFSSRPLKYESDAYNAIHGYLTRADTLSYCAVPLYFEKRRSGDSETITDSMNAFLRGLLWYRRGPGTLDYTVEPQGPPLTPAQSSELLKLFPSWSWVSLRRAIDCNQRGRMDARRLAQVYIEDDKRTLKTIDDILLQHSQSQQSPSGVISVQSSYLQISGRRLQVTAKVETLSCGRGLVDKTAKPEHARYVYHQLGVLQTALPEWVNSLSVHPPRIECQYYPDRSPAEVETDASFLCEANSLLLLGFTQGRPNVTLHFLVLHSSAHRVDSYRTGVFEAKLMFPGHINMNNTCSLREDVAFHDAQEFVKNLRWDIEEKRETVRLR